MLRSLVITLALLGAARPAHAREAGGAADAAVKSDDDPGCRKADTRGEWFPTCFDLGNRIFIGAGTDGIGGEIAVRHLVLTDDPGVTWRFEHHIFAATLGGHVERATLYEARYLRHSRDGHLMLPTSPPKRILLPFDVGVDAAVLGVTRRDAGELATVRVIRAGAFADLARSPDYRKRLALGITMRWDTDADVEAMELVAHRVVPFTGGSVDAGWESRSGLWRLGARTGGGVVWANTDGWVPYFEAEASAERVLVAVNDAPVSVYTSAVYDDLSGELVLAAGIRFAPIVSTRSPARPR